MRVRRLTAVLAISALALVACGDDDGGDSASSSGSGSKAEASFAAGTTMARLHDAGKVTVGTKFDQPLFGQKGIDGKVEGFDVEIAKIIADELGISEDNINFVETVSKNREPFIQEGKVDYVVATYTINDKRKQVISFAGPYYVAGQDIMVKKGDTSIKGPEDLAGKSVCSVEGSTPAEKIRTDYPQAKLVLFDAYSKCAEALKDGRVQAVTTDNVILVGFVDSDPESFELVGKPFTQEPYGIGVKKDDTEFRNFINDVLEKSFEDGRWAKAYEDTVGKVTGETPQPPKVDRYTAS